ncbi:hypothetical protein T12_991 [Trichinella patagoniensis]|uniref:PiggyBac transposable element-derived protein domain-containing protein n=1 Tax=Trichinella patagoniensis TaxID=990121 RepID=A0A0V0Z4T9_9BILA|nr:hypothetical protein T12_991 [Trichinella patagoniensis]
MKYLHFNDNLKAILNREIPSYDQLYKVRPLLEQFRNCCLKVCRPKLRLEEDGIWTCGTIRSNGLCGCPLMSEQALNAHVIFAVEWYDNRCVTLTPTYLSVKAQKRVIVKLPSIVHNYNMHMGGVDLNKMLSELYRLSRRS